jgi:hypothetical protein
VALLRLVRPEAAERAGQALQLRNIRRILDSYSLHPDLFAEDPETGKARLTDGVTVYGGEFLDGANRPDDYIWSVVDPEKLYRLPNSEKKA